MQIIPAQFGKSWQIVRQTFCQHFCRLLSDGKVWQSFGNKLPAICWQSSACVFFADLHYALCRQTGLCHSCHNTEVDGKVVGNCLAIFFCTGIAGKVLAKLPP